MYRFEIHNLTTCLCLHIPRERTLLMHEFKKHIRQSEPTMYTKASSTICESFVGILQNRTRKTRCKNPATTTSQCMLVSMPSSPPGSSSTTSRNGGSGWKLSCISMSAKNSINPRPRKLVKLARQLLCTSRIKFPYKWSQIIDFGCTLSTPFFLLSSPGHGTRTNTERCVCEFVFFRSNI